MKIEVLGTGCPKCQSTEQTVKKALAELNLQAEVVKVTDISAIIDRGVMSTPALVVDGKVMSSGRIPSAEEIKGWLK